MPYTHINLVEEGLRHLYLGTVNVLSAAQRFYEREGFTSIAKEDLPAWFPLMPADNVFYERALFTPSAQEDHFFSPTRN